MTKWHPTTRTEVPVYLYASMIAGFYAPDDLTCNDTSVAMDPTNPLSKSNYIERPNLEKLAKAGIVFSNGYAQNPLIS